jgi:hypothetical protein
MAKLRKKLQQITTERDALNRKVDELVTELTEQRLTYTTLNKDYGVLAAERDKLREELADTLTAMSGKMHRPAELKVAPNPKPRKQSKPKTEDKWGKPQYKTVAADRDGNVPTAGGGVMKVKTGNGCAVHPSKKKQYKIQGEKDPDTKNVRAMVAKVRPEPVFPSVPDDVDKNSQIITPKFRPESVEVEKELVYRTPYSFHQDLSRRNEETIEYKKYNTERERIAKANATKRIAAEERFQQEQVLRDQEKTRKLSQGNLAAYKALKFWVHHKIKETRGLTVADRTQMYREYQNRIRRIANDVATEHGTTRQDLAAWVSGNIDRETGEMIMPETQRGVLAA